MAEALLELREVSAGYGDGVRYVGRDASLTVAVVTPRDHCSRSAEVYDGSREQ